jgi:sulfite reductase beta subunit-like hemoprotein
MKNELIIARKHEQANARAAARLQEILQTLGLEELKERFA